MITSKTLSTVCFLTVPELVCYTAVFSVVTQRCLWGGALRDASKNGCVADYTWAGLFKAGLR